ncbi:unnamed protein product [Blepharisma stoltei]|uniref:Uncharacterized protein n=1 Tax=Blepharisma stoltei TaxID=1481888 RepID=A0AAU9JLF5_9CILI|nr:unnamed protein product [Blepharisma stoltei]
MLNLSDSLEFHPPATNSIPKHIDDYYYDFPLQFTPQSSIIITPPISSPRDEKTNEEFSSQKPSIEGSPVYLGDSRRSNKVSAMRIEDKLMQKQVLAQKRIEDLRTKREKEEMGKMRNKPKISKKSQELAKKAEQKLFGDLFVNISKSIISDIKSEVIEQRSPFRSSQECSPIYISPTEASPESNNMSSPTFKTTPFNESIEKQFTSHQIAKTPEPKPKKTIKKIPKTPSTSTRSASVHSRKEKSQSKSLLNLSVLERSNSWAKEKHQKVNKMIKAKEEKGVEECTFSPVIYSRVPHHLHNLKAKELHNMSKSKGSLMSGSISNSNSIIHLTPNVSLYHQENSLQQLKSLPIQYTSLTPCQFRVSFKSGCDIASFMTRANRWG